MTEPQKCPVKALKGNMDDHQLRAVYWMLKTEHLVGGGFCATTWDWERYVFSSFARLIQAGGD